MRRRLRGLVAAAAGSALIGTLIIPASAASWTDREWNHSTVGTLDCATMDSAETRGAGKVLGGNLLGTDLDPLAEVEDVVVVNDGTASSVNPQNATVLGNDAYANPLNVEALQSVNVRLTGLLVLPLGAEAGMVNQFGQANDTGYSAGAAGAVSNSGGIDLHPETDPELPRFATLELGTVLDQVLGEGTGAGITNLADVRLGIGAVASRAQLDSCTADWQGNIYSAMDRQYAIAGLDAELKSPLVGGLVSTTDASLGSLDSTVERLESTNEATEAITDLVRGPTGLGPVLGGLTADGLLVDWNSSEATLGLTIGLPDIDSLISQPIVDPGNTIRIDLRAGTVTIDLAAVLGPEYQNSAGLNGLAPNSQLLVNDSGLNALNGALASALDSWTARVTDSLTQAITQAKVHLSIAVPVKVLSSSLRVATLRISVGDPGGQGVSMESLRAGTADMTVAVERDGICSVPIVGEVCGVLGGLSSGVAGFTADEVLGPLVGSFIFNELLASVESLGTNMQTPVSPLVSLISTTLRGLFGPDSALSLTANAQNQPDPAELAGLDPARTEPDPWQELEGTGHYDVAALRIDVLGPLKLATLELARSSVGPNTVR